MENRTNQSHVIYEEGKRQNSLHLKTAEELVLQTKLNWNYNQTVLRALRNYDKYQWMQNLPRIQKSRKKRETDRNHREPINKNLQETRF